MPELVFGHDREIADWVAERIPEASEFGACTAIGVATPASLVAGLVYHDYHRDAGNLQLTMAADSPVWATRPIIAGLLHYPFRQLGCWSVHALVRPDNGHALKTFKHVGLRKKTVIPHAFGKKAHAVFCQMTLPEFSRLYEVPNG